MANVGNAVRQLGQSFGKLGSVLGKTFDKAARTEAAEEVIKFTKAATQNPDRGKIATAFGWSTWGARKPVELATRGVSKVVDGVATLYGRAPRVTTGLAVGAAGLGVVGLVNERGNRNEAMERQAIAEQQYAQLQAQQAAMMAPQSYKNSVTPQESALLDERLSAGGNNGSMGDKVMADRAAAAQAAPTTV